MEKPFALIIEDDRDIVALFRHVMDMAGYRTEIALNGRVAVDHLTMSKPDIVLLDLNLPGVSGGEILVMMNASERLKNVPVVVVTANPGMVAKLAVKPQLVLMKPVNIEQMSNLIQRICPTERTVEKLPWDILTGVYNRSFFLARLNYALEHARQQEDTRFAVLYLELGQSAKLEYLFGSEHNTRVLKDSAGILKSILRPTDTIARLGGETFAVLIEEVANPDAPIMIATRIQNKVRKYLSRLENELQMRANVGVALCGQEFTTADEVLHAAEQALALAKADRKKMTQPLPENPLDAGWRSSVIQ
jgi:diguanylate cyclase (GGDEF)-like protein